MPSLALFIIYIFVLFFSSGFTQEFDSAQDFDPSSNDQPPYFSTSQTLVASQPTEGSDLENTLENTSFTDMTDGSRFGDFSLFTDMDVSDINDLMLSSNLLEASCTNNDRTQPGKLRARDGLSCIDPSASNRASFKSKPSTRNAGDAVGVMTSDSNWCIDPQFALYHTVAICDQLHTGVPQPSGYHWVVYPSSLSQFFTLKIYITQTQPSFPSLSSSFSTIPPLEILTNEERRITKQII